jgi:hypothetical protein
MGGIVRRIEPRRGRLGGNHDDERITGEQCRRPVGKQYGFKSGVVLRSSLVIRVEYAVASRNLFIVAGMRTQPFDAGRPSSRSR